MAMSVHAGYEIHARAHPLPEATRRTRILLGRYQLGALIGKGGMGTVYQAVDLQEQCECAVKLLSEPQPLLAETYRRFAREASVVAQIYHPHIVHIRDFACAEDGTPFLVMELLNGQDLFSIARGGRRLPLAYTLDVLQQVGSALAAMHSIGVIHRDIKPQNIFICQGSDQAGGIVKLVDFGLSMVQGEEQLTTAGTIVGTIEYLAPEGTFGNSQALDAYSDQWSLAVVAYRLLSGKLPFQNDNMLARISCIREARPILLSDHNPMLPPHVCAAVHRGLSVHKKDRHPSIATFIDALCGRVSPSLQDDGEETPAEPTNPSGPPEFMAMLTELPAPAAPPTPTVREQLRTRKNAPPRSRRRIAALSAVITLASTLLFFGLAYRSITVARHLPVSAAGTVVQCSQERPVTRAAPSLLAPGQGPLAPPVAAQPVSEVPAAPRPPHNAGKSARAAVRHYHTALVGPAPAINAVDVNAPPIPAVSAAAVIAPIASAIPTTATLATAPLQPMAESHGLLTASAALPGKDVAAGPGAVRVAAEVAVPHASRALLPVRHIESCGRDPHLPPQISRALRGTTTRGVYQVCVAENGAVLSVKTLYGILGADDEIHQTLRTWRCPPWPVPSCFELEFQFVSE